MPRRLSPIMLLSIVIVLVLSLGLFAGAQGGGGAVGTALGQVGKPYAFGTDGPNTFSCTGLVRFALRSIGIMDAPWDHYAYLSAYPNVSKPEPGDVVVFPDGAAMYVGNDQVVMANHADGKVGTYPMGAIGVPVGFARPTGEVTDTADGDPATGDQTKLAADDQTKLAGQGAYDPVPTDAPMADEPALLNEPAPIEPAPDESGVPVLPAPIEPAPNETGMIEPAAIEPAAIEPAPVEPAAIEPAPAV
jgi:hypothetical protein